MCLVTMYCWVNFQSTLGVHGPSHHVHQTWVPVIISFGATSKIVCTTPTGNFVVCLQQVQKVRGSQTKHVHMRPHAHKLLMEVCVHSCIIWFCTTDNYEHTIQRNCYVCSWIPCIWYYNQTTKITDVCVIQNNRKTALPMTYTFYRLAWILPLICITVRYKYSKKTSKWPSQLPPPTMYHKFSISQQVCWNIAELKNFVENGNKKSVYYQNLHSL
jgi:hypothetical protein